MRKIILLTGILISSFFSFAATHGLYITEWVYDENLQIDNIYCGGAFNCCEYPQTMYWELKRDGITVASDELPNYSGWWKGQTDCMGWYINPKEEATRAGYTMNCDHDWTLFFNVAVEESQAGYEYYTGTVNLLIDPVLTVSSASQQCAGTNQNFTYDLNYCDGTFTYDFNLTGTGVTYSHNAATKTITVVASSSAPTQTAKLYVNANCNEYPSLDQTVVRNISILRTPGTISGEIEGQASITTFGIPYTYTISGTSSGSTSHTWEISPSNSYSSFTKVSNNEINVFWSNSFNGDATVSVYGTNICADGVADTKTVNIVGLPGKASKPSGVASVCQNGANENYTTSATNSTSYEYDLSPSTAGTISVNSSTCTINFNNSYSGSASLKARGVNSAGAGVWSDPLTITINPLPGKAAAPTGASTVCQNGANEIYLTSGATNATSYNYLVTPSSSASTTGTGTSVTLDWSSSYHGSITLQAQGQNGCGTGVWSDSKTITVNPLPTQPNVPTGNIDVCEGGSDPYSVAGDLYSTSWSWELSPSNYGVISGNGTRNITIDWANGVSGDCTLRAKGINSCGEGAYSLYLEITVNPKPEKAAKPSGETEPCQGGTFSYSSVGAVNGVSYQYEVVPSEAAESITVTGSNASIKFSNSFSGNADIRLRAENDCGLGSYSDYLNIDIQPKPLKASIPSGEIEVCQGTNSTTYTTLGSVNSSSLVWQISKPEAGSISGTSSTSTMNWNSGFVGSVDITVYGINSCGDGVVSDALTVQRLPLPGKPAIPSGATGICQGTISTIYSTSGATNADNYTYEITPSTCASLSVSGQAVTVNWNPDFAGTANLRVKGNNTCGSGAYSDYLTITVDPLPAKPTKPTGNTSPCQGGTYQYFTTVATNADSYIFTATPSDAIESINTSGTAVTINFDDAYTGQILLDVKGQNSCGSGQTSESLAINISPKPGKAAKPSGAIEVCQGISSTTYTTQTLTNAGSYVWEISNPLAGNISGTNTSSTMNWNSDFVGSVDITVYGTNGCGDGVVSDALTVQRLPLPGKPATPSGTTNICQGTLNTIYTTNGGTNTDNYSYEITPSTCASLSVSGQAVTVNWNPDFAGTANLRVVGTNNCGSGVYSDYLTINVSPLPAKPAKPSGEVNPCQGGTYQYSTTTTANSLYYDWSATPAEAIESISGTGKVVTIDFADNYTGNILISVRGENNCGYGILSEDLSVNISPLPGKSAKPSGEIEVCQGTTTTAYSIPETSNADYYSWSVNSVAGSIVGATVNSTLYWSSSFVGEAKIVVTPHNVCGEGTPSDTLKVTKHPLPVKGATPTGQTTLCQNSGDIIYISNTIQYATSYEWSVYPTESAQIIGSGRSITLRYSPTYSGLVRLAVRGKNACGDGEWSEDLIIQVNALPSVSLSNFNVKCSNGDEFLLTGGFPTGGQYTWAGYPVTSFDPETAGVGEHTITYTYADGNGCYNSASNVITVYDHPETPEISESYIVNGNSYVYGIAGQTVNIEIENPSGNYFWYNEASLQNLVGVGSNLTSSTLPNSLDNLSYWVTAYDGTCYSSPKKVLTKSVIKPGTPQILNDDDVCLGETIELIAVKNNAPSAEYNYKSVWYNSSMNRIHTGDTLTVTYDQEQRYYLSTLDSVFTGYEHLLNESDKVNVLVNIAEVTPVTLSIEDEYCKYDDVVLSASGGSNTIVWYDDSYNQIHEGNSFAVGSVTDDCTYYVSARNIEGCESNKVQANINIQNVVADFISDVSSINIGGKVQFTNNSLNAVSYTWNFGDNSSPVTLESPEHYYYTSGTFDVQLIATSDISCSDTLTKVDFIHVLGGTTGIEDFKGDFKVYPNPFKNTMVIENHFDAEISIVVYNITGNKIFETNSTKDKIFIDLTYKPSGMYFIEVRNGSDKFVKKLIKE